MEIGEVTVKKVHTKVLVHEVTHAQYRGNQQTKYCSCGAITVVKYRNTK